MAMWLEHEFGQAGRIGSIMLIPGKLDLDCMGIGNQRVFRLNLRRGR
jgi:hypothetical protein